MDDPKPNIDVIGYLEDRGIKYLTSGKNVGHNDVNINCVFCSDPSFHLGIHRETGIMHCWSCEFSYEARRPTFVDLIRLIDSCSWLEAKQTFKLLQNRPMYLEAKSQPRAEALDLPETEELGYGGGESLRALVYLRSRKFDYEVVGRFGLRLCTSGSYAYRIIVPIYYCGKLVNFLGRSYVPAEPLRYKNCRSDLCVMKPSEVLYNFDRVKEVGSGHLRIVEGVTDVWRYDGCDTVGLFTNRLSRLQKALIINELRPRTLTVALDPDAYSIAFSIGAEFAPLVNQVKILLLESGEDVADLELHDLLALEADTSPQHF